MLATVKEILQSADDYAVGGFNVYNLEGVQAVIRAAEQARSVAIIQVHPAALTIAGIPLLNLALTYAQSAHVPIAVHLDHTTDLSIIETALSVGVSSVMADGAHLPYTENVRYVQAVAQKAHAVGACVEAELGLISGKEDGITVESMYAKMTNPAQVVDYISATGADTLAVCIGNVHGPYPMPPQLDFDRLEEIHNLVDIPLVLHGASGLDEDLIRCSIQRGIRKFNVNTEVRKAYLSVLRESSSDTSNDLVDIMQAGIDAMVAVIVSKMNLFGSTNRSLT